MHGKFLAIQQNRRNSILFHETIPLIKQFNSKNVHLKKCLKADLLYKFSNNLTCLKGQCHEMVI
jgi:hypothetical protein